MTIYNVLHHLSLLTTLYNIGDNTDPCHCWKHCYQCGRQRSCSPCHLTCLRPLNFKISLCQIFQDRLLCVFKLAPLILYKYNSCIFKSPTCILRNSCLGRPHFLRIRVWFFKGSTVFRHFQEYS